MRTGTMQADAAEIRFPYQARRSKRYREREVRDSMRLAREFATAGEAHPKRRKPRKPRFMRPSTALAAATRKAERDGPGDTSCGTVVDIEAYHAAYCASLDVSTTEGQRIFAEVNSRYAGFWAAVPHELAALQRRHVGRHRLRARRSQTSMHQYMQVKAAPTSRDQFGTSHHQALIRLYAHMVKHGGTRPPEGSAGGSPAESDFFHCAACDVQTVRHRFELQCPSCHVSVSSVSSRDRNFKEYSGCDTSSVVTYKRINHFNEWMLRTQGIEQRTVPPEVLAAVEARLRLVRLPLTIKSKPKKVYDVVRNALAQSGYQDYFEHVPQIIKLITPLSPPRLTDEQTNAVRAAFIAVQEPFERLKPKKRQNFLSYAYVIYKLCELLEHDDMLPFCPLFKSVQNQRNADTIWKSICHDRGYEFIPTV